MALLMAGLALLIGVHLIPTVGGLRERLVSSLGLWTYKGLFSLASLAGLVMII